MLELVKNVVPVSALEFLIQVPLGEFYRLSAQHYQDKQIVAHMSFDEDLPAISLYVRKAA